MVSVLRTPTDRFKISRLFILIGLLNVLGHHALQATQENAQDDIVFKNGELIKSSYSYKGFDISTVLIKPVDATDFYTIIIVPGYPCQNVLASGIDHPYLKFAQAMLDKNVATLILEKPGTGDSDKSLNCNKLGFDEETIIFQKGYESALEMTEINSKKVILFGHSMGGKQIARIASNKPPNGLMIYGVGASTWFEYMMGVVKTQFPMFGTSYSDAEYFNRTNLSAQYAFYYEDKSPIQIVRDNASAELYFKNVYSWDGKEMLMGRHYSYWQELNKQNLAQELNNTSFPILVLHGSSDVASYSREDAEKIALMANQQFKGRATFLEVKDTNHHMLKITRADNLNFRSRGTYGQMRKQLDTNPLMINSMLAWIEDIKDSN